MADHDLPEIPPNGSGRGKQIVFLFMSAVVIAVVIFLLGVSVGRGVRRQANAPDGADAGDTNVVATNPARTTAADLATRDVRSTPPATADPGGSSKPVTPPGEQAMPPPPVSEVPPPIKSGKDDTRSGSKPQTPPAAKAPVHAGEYSLQVGAFNAISAARSLLAQVKARDKSYPVSVVTLPESEPGRYRVMVGPFATADEANQMKSRLKKDKFDAILKR